MQVKVDLFNNIIKTAFPNFDNLIVASWNVVSVYANVGSDFPELHRAVVELKGVLEEFESAYAPRTKNGSKARTEATSIQNGARGSRTSTPVPARASLAVATHPQDEESKDEPRTSNTNRAAPSPGPPPTSTPPPDQSPREPTQTTRSHSTEPRTLEHPGSELMRKRQEYASSLTQAHSSTLDQDAQSEEQSSTYEQRRPAPFLGNSVLGARKNAGSVPVAPMLHVRKEGGGGSRAY